MTTIERPTTSQPAWTVSQVGVIRSELIKLRTVRSTYWTYLIAVVATVGLGLLFSWGSTFAYSEGELPPEVVWDSAGTALSGIFMSQLATAILGVMFVTSEYSSGMIRSTFSAVPTRLPVLFGKVVALTVVTFVVTLVAAFAVFYLSMPIFATEGLETTIGEPGVLRAVVGCAMYLTVIALMGMALGLIVRSTAGAVAIIVGVLFVLPILVSLPFLPQAVSWNLTKWLPGTAGQSIIQVEQQANLLPVWAGFGVFCGYVVVLMVAGAYVMKKRDA